MSNPEPQKSLLPESTYAPGDRSEADAFARKLFFISVGSAALPVLVAAGVMLQSGSALGPKPATSLAARRAPTPSLASTPTRTVAAKDTTPQSETPVVEPTPIRFTAYSTLADQVGQLQSLRAASDSLQGSELLRLALIPIPPTTSIREADLVTTEEPDTDSRPIVNATSHAKKIRAEIKTHPIAQHRHRPQKHTPPTLLARIGQSVKKGLIEAAKFPRQAMERRFWD